MTIAAIQTEYDGHLFRSRLEARWAVFFNHLGIVWKYEPEGYRISDGRGAYRQYLPDFYLPKHDCWVEVKGSDSGADWTMWRRAANDAGRGLLVLGDVPKTDGWLHPYMAGCDCGGCHDKEWGWAGWCRDGALQIYRRGDGDTSPLLVVGRSYIVDRNDARAEAYRAARTARFEFGETPTVTRPHSADEETAFGRLTEEQRRAVVLLSVGVGTQLRHPKFGIGTVLTIDDSAEAHVHFGGDFGIKRLLLTHAHCEVIPA